MARKVDPINRLVEIWDAGFWVSDIVQGVGFFRRILYSVFASRLLFAIVHLHNQYKQRGFSIARLEKESLLKHSQIRMLQLDLEEARRVDPTAEFLDNQRNFSQNQTIRRLKDQVRALGGILEED
jgi:hypothetical protein